MQIGWHAFELMKEFEHELAGLGSKMYYRDDGRSGGKRLCHHVTSSMKAINCDAQWEVVFQKEDAWRSKVSLENLSLINRSWVSFNEYCIDLVINDDIPAHSTKSPSATSYKLRGRLAKAEGVYDSSSPHLLLLIRI